MWMGVVGPVLPTVGIMDDGRDHRGWHRYEYIVILHNRTVRNSASSPFELQLSR